MTRKAANRNGISGKASAIVSATELAPDVGANSTASSRSIPRNSLPQKNVRTIEPASPATEQHKRVAAYARVSLESKELIHSISAQVSYYSKLIRQNPGWIYAGVFADSGISGTSTDRPEFQRMLAECEAGNIDIILTKSISRFARNTVDLLVTVRHLKELGIEVRFERENIRSLSGEGELMLTILASYAQAESRNISENCKWGIRGLYEKGRTRFQPMYGYRIVDKKLVVMEEEAQVVRRIFQMYLDGFTAYEIAKKLTQEGISSLRGKKFGTKGIKYMLQQEKYTGCTIGQKYYVADHITHKEIRNNGELPMYFIEGTHPAIISTETFRAVQKELWRRSGADNKSSTTLWWCDPNNSILFGDSEAPEQAKCPKDSEN